MNKIYFIVAMIVVFYFSVNSIQKFNINYEVLDELIQEFNSGYIEDITVLSAADNSGNQTECPANYTSLIKNFNWPGNFKGCGCKKEDGSNQYKFYTGTCPMMKDCRSVEETNEVELNLWKGKLICYKRSMISYDKLNLFAYENRDACNNSTHRTCGVIDGHNNLLCLSKDKNCPVTKIIFSKVKENKPKNETNAINNTIVVNNTIPILNNSSSLNSSSIIKDTINNSTIDKENSTINSQSNSSSIQTPSLNNNMTKTYKLNDDTLLTISYEELSLTSIPTYDSNLIFSFFRTDLSKPCFNPMRSPSSENFFPLMKKKFDLMCDKYENGTEITDDSFMAFGEYSLEEYYKNNNFHTNLHKVLDPFKIDISKEKIKLYGRGYAGWSIQCQKSNPEALRSFLIMSDEMNQISISIIIHSFISLAGLIFIGVLACFVSQYFDLFFKATELGFVIFNLIFPIQIISNSNWVINILTDEYGALCGDRTFNMLLLDISAACMSLQYSFIMILLIAILSCIIFIFMLYSWIKPATREVQENLIQMR
jgi:hypothetical protein